MAGLALVRPALRLLSAHTVEAWGVGKLAEPATNEDVLEAVSLTRGKDLSHGAGVELMVEASNGLVGGLLCVGGELRVNGESAEAHLGAPHANDTLP